MTTPEPDAGIIEIHAADGTVIRQVEPYQYIDLDAMMARLRHANEMIARLSSAMLDFRRTYFEFPEDEAHEDHRQGPSIPINAVRPGQKLFVLGDVFTVASVDTSPFHTVWLTELPDSPLYFNDWDLVPTANESDD